MGIFYVNVGTCCLPSRRKSVFFWPDCNVLKASSGIHSRHHRHRFLTANDRRYPRCLRRHRPCRQHQSGTDYMTAPVTLVATSDNRTEHPAHVRTVSVSTSWEHRRRRRSRHREPHRRRSRSHHRRLPGRPDDAVPTSRRHAYNPKYPPAVKAMPACRPSGLSYDR